MNHFSRFISFICLFAILHCTTKNETPTPTITEVAPWCILGFDALDRTPEERIDMLKTMGFKEYGYNRGNGNFLTMKEEFQLAQNNDININSIFLWLNAKRDSLGKFSPSNQLMLDNLKAIDQKPTIWVSFSDNFFEDLSQEASVQRAVDMLQFVKQTADEVGCPLALYNHHGWFGNPHHQVEILEQLNMDDLTMVYNFHHAHDYIDEFPEVAKKIIPYLSHVTLNGMRKDGPQIYPLGQGEHELDMIKALLDAGYEGTWGILGHVKTEDVQLILQENMIGLDSLNHQLLKAI
ncbi:MAG: sugar phosphate isomerase/epimerase [Saprospiraceae bacterium]|nr:sugar phosphate isomerase/epimerase [Saprospiraceae bacterium]